METPRAIVAAGTVAGRRNLTLVVTGETAGSVLAATPDLKTALARVTQYRPEVLVVADDVDLEGLPAVRAARPEMAIYVVAPEREGRRTQALAAGAVPVAGSAELVLRMGARPARPGSGLGSAASRRPPAATGLVELLAIGCSTGGPAALAEVLKGLPASLSVPVVLVQHMPASFTKVLAGRLDAVSPLRVREATGGEVLEPGHVWVAPGERHLTVAREGDALVTRLNGDPPECFCRPSVDVLFRSVAATVGGNSVAVVLTGMGQDGLRGATALREAGATIVAQDEATSVVWGMPGYVTRAGLAHVVLPLPEIAPALLGMVRSTRPSRGQLQVARGVSP